MMEKLERLVWAAIAMEKLSFHPGGIG